MTKYRYNPACPCDWCRRGGEIPQGTGDNGHAFGYAQPHIPPGSGPWRQNQPRIMALLSFYDETPAWLTRCVESLQKIGVTDLIALDGPYDLYEKARSSPPEPEWDAIQDAAGRIGIGHSTSVLAGGWQGNEVEKRNHLFSIAEIRANPEDWYFVVDADEFVTYAPQDLPERLNATPFDVGAVKLIEPGHPLGTMIYPTHPKFFRAIPGLRAVGDHFTYTTPDGRKLWGDAKRARLEPRADLTTVVVEHHNQLRHTDRRRAALDYYDTRDGLGIEELPANRSILSDAA